MLEGGGNVLGRERQQWQSFSCRKSALIGWRTSITLKEERREGGEKMVSTSTFFVVVVGLLVESPSFPPPKFNLLLPSFLITFSFSSMPRPPLRRLFPQPSKNLRSLCSLRRSRVGSERSKVAGLCKNVVLLLSSSTATSFGDGYLRLLGTET